MEEIGKCRICGVWTQLPHADFMCESCGRSPWRIRALIEELEASAKDVADRVAEVQPNRGAIEPS